MPSMGDSPYKSMPYIDFSCKGIQNLLDNLRVNKAPGPDRIPVRILKDYSGEIAPILQLIFNLSLHKGELPDDWQTAHMCHLKKKGDSYQKTTDLFLSHVCAGKSWSVSYATLSWHILIKTTS